MTTTTAFYVAVPIVAALLMNALIYGMGWNSSSKSNDNNNGNGPVRKNNPVLPPGWVIGLAWVVILGCLGYVYFLLSSIGAGAILFIILWCLMYPVLTGGLRKNIGPIMNTATLILSFGAALAVCMTTDGGRRDALWFMTPLLLWVSYVNIADAAYCGFR
jgi:tryptophan-rich sensory protein